MLFFAGIRGKNSLDLVVIGLALFRSVCPGCCGNGCYLGVFAGFGGCPVDLVAVCVIYTIPLDQGGCFLRLGGDYGIYMFVDSVFGTQDAAV